MQRKQCSKYSAGKNTWKICSKLPRRSRKHEFLSPEEIGDEIGMDLASE